MQKHILIVDDEPQFRFSAAIALKKAGYEISEAGDGEEALTLILDTQNNTPFDLLLLDIRMAGMSGIELIDILKGKGNLIPIFVISGFADKELIMELLRKGCAGFLDKPCEPRELVEQVEKIL